MYLAVHNLLRAHVAALKVYRREHQEAQCGKIEITMNKKWTAPVDAGDVATVAVEDHGLELERCGDGYRDSVRDGMIFRPRVLQRPPADHVRRSEIPTAEVLRHAEALAQKISDFFDLNY